LKACENKGKTLEEEKQKQSLLPGKHHHLAKNYRNIQIL
jgi:hypothetical protein